MNTLQSIALCTYVIVLAGYLYYYTDGFKKGWYRNLRYGPIPESRKGALDFRIVLVVIVVGFTLFMKWIGVK